MSRNIILSGNTFVGKNILRIWFPTLNDLAYFLLQEKQKHQLRLRKDEGFTKSFSALIRVFLRGWNFLIRLRLEFIKKVGVDPHLSSTKWSGAYKWSTHDRLWQHIFIAESSCTIKMRIFIRRRKKRSSSCQDLTEGF